ncbi:MAG: cysteine synthase A [Eggerthellaceae bacterium]|nr:cysteine synthase A [Eggerthellaceae bacterium]
MSIHKSIAELIGNTPLVELTHYEQNHSLKATIVGKVEFFNPAGSVKDRIAKSMLDAALAAGRINESTTLIEPTSGNTGIGLAAIAATHGMRLILTMPETMSVERRNLAKAYGAEIVLTDGSAGMKGAIDKANELCAEIENSFIPSQFTNPANPSTHEFTTGPEIWRDTEGKVDLFVAGVGTGGTLTGVGRYLKGQNPDVKVIAVEPANSPVLSGGNAGSHGLQGIGAGFVPETLDTTIYDEVIAIQEEEAYEAARELSAKDGLLVGISAGAAVSAARKVAERPESEGKLIVVILPDTGERYLSTPLFDF